MKKDKIIQLKKEVDEITKVQRFIHKTLFYKNRSQDTHNLYIEIMFVLGFNRYKKRKALNRMSGYKIDKSLKLKSSKDNMFVDAFKITDTIK